MDSIPNPPEETGLSLPIMKKDLGQFIYSLLGQPQSIERELNIAFNIDHAWLINLHQTLIQRIQMQAEAQLVSFKVVIAFDDGLKRTLSTIEAFESYQEMKKKIPISIKIIWNYLVKFPQKEIPEKQQISFSAKIHHIVKFSSDEKSKITNLHSTIRYQIDYTERTWGDDIESLMSSQVDEIEQSETKFDNIYNKLRLLLGGLLPLVAIYVIYQTIFFVRSQKIDDLMVNFNNTFEGKIPSSEVISTKIDYLAQLYQVYAVKDIEQVYAVILFFLSIVLTIVLLNITRKRTYSFIVISKSSEEYRENVLKKEGRKNSILLGSYILSIGASVLGSFAYHWMTN